MAEDKKSAGYLIGPREMQILSSFNKMGMRPQNQDAFRAKMQEADRMRLIAMDPNKSKSMTQEEKEFYMNQPSMLLRSVGGFEGGFGFGGAGGRRQVERGSATPMSGEMGGSRLQAQTPRLDAMRRRRSEMTINRPEMDMSGYA
jgi:hypothetical protein